MSLYVKKKCNELYPTFIGKLISGRTRQKNDTIALSKHFWTINKVSEITPTNFMSFCPFNIINDIVILINMSLLNNIFIDI